MFAACSLPCWFDDHAPYPAESAVPISFGAFFYFAVLILCINKSYISVIRFNRLIKKFKYSVCSCKCHDDCIKLLRNLHDRHIYGFVERKITSKRTDCKPADIINRKESSNNRNNNETQVAELSVDRSEDIDKFSGA